MAESEHSDSSPAVHFDLRRTIWNNRTKVTRWGWTKSNCRGRKILCKWPDHSSVPEVSKNLNSAEELAKPLLREASVVIQSSDACTGKRDWKLSCSKSFHPRSTLIGRLSTLSRGGAPFPTIENETKLSRVVELSRKIVFLSNPWLQSRFYQEDSQNQLFYINLKLRFLRAFFENN